MGKFFKLTNQNNNIWLVEGTQVYLYFMFCLVLFLFFHIIESNLLFIVYVLWWISNNSTKEDRPQCMTRWKRWNTFTDSTFKISFFRCVKRNVDRNDWQCLKMFIFLLFSELALARADAIFSVLGTEILIENWWRWKIVTEKQKKKKCHRNKITRKISISICFWADNILNWTK